MLVLLSAFFSASETGLMGVNRYKLKNAANKGDKVASRVVHLLKSPDRTLSVILMGNTAANLLLSSIATVLATKYFGATGILICTAILTLVVLIFVEITPKTLAALRPMWISRWVAIPLCWLLRLLGPLVSLLSTVAKGVLYLFGVRDLDAGWSESLGKEELKGVLQQARAGNKFVSDMMMGVLNLDEIHVDDVMLSRSAIAGVDISKTWVEVVNAFAHAHRMRMIVHNGNIDKALGICHLTDVIQLQQKNQFNRDNLIKVLKPIHYVPEKTALVMQLKNFQTQNYSLGLVVDEYGEVIGMVALDDIIEEIVGEYTQQSLLRLEDLRPNNDGSYWILGTMVVRDLNRALGWHLPEDGPNTVNGLITETLECIPDGQVCLMMDKIRIEVVRIRKNRVELIKVWPK
tara:strand:+ start:129 stop:1340 length:1212 start_codon:yes stop_codon:yes gene_type:complete